MGVSAGAASSPMNLASSATPPRTAAQPAKIVCSRGSRSRKLALNRNSRRAVNLRNETHVAQTFFTRRLRLQPILDAVGEVFGFGLEVRRVARRVEFVKFPARAISAQPQSFVDEGRVDFEPAFRSMDAIE